MEKEPENEKIDYLKKEIEITDEFRLSVISGTPANLLFHTLNKYDLIWNHGKSYSQFPDIKNDIPDENLKNELTESNNLASIIHKFIAQNPKNVDELIKLYNENEQEKALSSTLKKSWENFYKDYWARNGSKLNQIVESNIAKNDWLGPARQMEILTDKKFNSDFYLIYAEALAESAMKVEPNICIGAIHSNSMAGFTHEGLHLLLNEEWANDSRIKNIMPANWNDIGGWGTNWKRKFEQAIVVALDCLIRNANGKASSVSDYFNGCNVGDLKKYFFEPLKNWYQQKIQGRTSEKIADIVFKILDENSSALLDKFKQPSSAN